MIVAGIDPGFGPKTILKSGWAIITDGKPAAQGLYQARPDIHLSTAARELVGILIKNGAEVACCDSFLPYVPGAVMKNSDHQVHGRNELSLACALAGIPLVFMESQEIKTTMLPVFRGMRKDHRNKIEIDYLSRLYGIDTNEHVRDAVFHGLWLSERRKYPHGFTQG